MQAQTGAEDQGIEVSATQAVGLSLFCIALNYLNMH